MLLSKDEAVLRFSIGDYLVHLVLACGWTAIPAHWIELATLLAMVPCPAAVFRITGIKKLLPCFSAPGCIGVLLPFCVFFCQALDIFGWPRLRCPHPGVMRWSVALTVVLPATGRSWRHSLKFYERMRLHAARSIRPGHGRARHWQLCCKMAPAPRHQTVVSAKARAAKLLMFRRKRLGPGP